MKPINNLPPSVKRINCNDADHPLYEWQPKLGGLFPHRPYEAQRITTAAHIARHRDAMDKYGFMGVLVFIRTNKIEANDNRYHYYLIDGQHRFEALKSSNKPICFYIINEDDSEVIVNTMASLNNVGKPWTGENFATAFSRIASKSFAYLALIMFTKRFGLSYSMASQLLMFGHCRIHRNDHLKRGTLCINYEEYAQGIMMDYLSILSHKEVENRGSIYKNKHFSEGYINFRHDVGEKYNHKKFVQALLKDIIPTVNARLLSEDWTQKFTDLHKQL
jgi:hypothetical protein